MFGVIDHASVHHVSARFRLLHSSGKREQARSSRSDTFWNKSSREANPPRSTDTTATCRDTCRVLDQGSMKENLSKEAWINCCPSSRPAGTTMPMTLGDSIPASIQSVKLARTPTSNRLAAREAVGMDVPRRIASQLASFATTKWQSAPRLFRSVRQKTASLNKALALHRRSSPQEGWGCHRHMRAPP